MISFQRPGRKIANTPLKLGKNQLKKSKKPLEKIVKKHEEKLAEKDDNLAVESKVVVTKVKPGKAQKSKKSSTASKPKLPKLAKASGAADRAAYNPPAAPKFIIKQAGEIIHTKYQLILRNTSIFVGSFFALSQHAQFLQATYSAFMRQMISGRSSQLIDSPHTHLPNNLLTSLTLQGTHTYPSRSFQLYLEIHSSPGPSQTFGWVGHGRYAPLNIPNIFKAAGINTKWIPEVISV